MDSFSVVDKRGIHSLVVTCDDNLCPLRGMEIWDVHRIIVVEVGQHYTRVGAGLKLFVLIEYLSDLSISM